MNQKDEQAQGSELSAGLGKGRRFFSFFFDDNEFKFHRTLEEAKKQSEDAINKVNSWPIEDRREAQFLYGKSIACFGEVKGFFKEDDLPIDA